MPSTILLKEPTTGKLLRLNIHMCLEVHRNLTNALRVIRLMFCRLMAATELMLLHQMLLRKPFRLDLLVLESVQEHPLGNSTGQEF
jgi:hypothetical protein